MNQKQSGIKQTAENSCIWRLLGSTELQKSAKEEKEKSTYHIDPDIRAQEWQILPLSISDPLHFSELPYGTPHLSERQKAEGVRQRESQTHREREGGGVALVLVWRWRGLLQLCTPVSISSNPILSSMCVCSTAEKGNGHKVILLHTAQRKRERERAREGERQREREKQVRKRRWKKTSELEGRGSWRIAGSSLHRFLYYVVEPCRPSGRE